MADLSYLVLNGIKIDISDETAREILTKYENALGTVTGKTDSLEVNDTNVLATSKATNKLNENLEKNHTIKTYHDISQFGCTSTFIPDIAVAMPQHSYFERAISSEDNGIGANTDNKIPYNAGVLTIEKASSYVRVMFTGGNSGASNGNLYLASINLNTKVLNKWYQFTGDLGETKTYNHVSQLGITSWFIPDIINAMPVNSRFCCDSGQGLNAESKNKLPLNLGVLTIDKPTNSRFRVMFNYSSQNSIGQMYIASVDIPNLLVNDWYEIGNPSCTRDNVVPDGTNCVLQGDSNYLWVEKSSNQVNMYGRVYFPKELTINEWHTIGQIPEGYYPKYTHGNTLFSVYLGSHIECTISNTGVIQIRPQTVAPKGWFPVASISWFTN